MGFEEEIYSATQRAIKAKFDMDKILDFCWKNRVEVLVQDDCMCHCYINYKEGDGHYACELDTLSALIVGIENYITHHQNES